MSQKKIDFGLAFFMIHEVSDKAPFLKELKSILDQNGQILLVEPKLFHVSRKEFDLTLKIAEDVGFKIDRGPQLRLGWSAILSLT